MSPRNPTLKDLKPASYNPRRISDPALKALTHSLEQFGDIGGIVWNERTGHLVTGHQRLKALRDEYGDGLKMEGGIISTPAGKQYPVRIVDWPVELERAANLAANSPVIGGEFTDALDPLLKQVQADLPELFGELMLPNLRERFGVPDFPPSPENEQARLDEKAKIQCPECGHEFRP